MEKIDRGQPLIVTNKDIIWNNINWKIQINNVQRLRNRIFRATTELRNTLTVKRNRGQRKLPPPTKEQLAKAKSLKRKIGNLQKLLTRSLSNILVSVRKVTQINNGKNTAGVDKILITTPEKREELIKIIQGNLRKGYTPKAILRKFIPKKNGKVRPLGIPTVYDRCIQNMVRNSLEPYWEAHFEGISYGFRPCRSTHDAIAKIYNLARPHKTKKWIVDADIEKCFDNITHETLLEIVGNFPYRKYIEQWLKCGVMNNNTLEMSQSGTPQGGVISPLLANIALHGMEEALGVKYNSNGEIRGNRAIVRYADDFVIFCESRLDSKQAIKDLEPFLSKRGLNLSEAKTKIVHITEGFDFLGYNIRQYKVSNTKTGYKCLIKPSKESIKNVKYKIKQIFKECLSKPLDLLIGKINELVRGWGNYYRNAVSKKVFSHLDTYVYKRCVRYVKRTHPTKPRKFTDSKYWGRFQPSRDDKWVFGNKANGNYITKFAWIKIKRHELIEKTNSPDNPELREYFAKRKKKLDKLESEKFNARWRNIAIQQNFTCPHCQQSLFNGESTEIHHIIPRALGGSDYTNNLVILHYYCHKAQHKVAVRATQRHKTDTPKEQHSTENVTEEMSNNKQLSLF